MYVDDFIGYLCHHNRNSVCRSLAMDDVHASISDTVSVTTLLLLTY